MGWNHKFLKSGEQVLVEGTATKKHASLAGGMVTGAIIGGVGAAATGAAMSQTTGRLFLTNKRLVLSKHIFMMFGTKIVEEITLRMIDSVTDVPDPLYNYIKIDTKDDKSHLFDVAPTRKEEWLKKISDAALKANN